MKPISYCTAMLKWTRFTPPPPLGGPVKDECICGRSFLSANCEICNKDLWNGRSLKFRLHRPLPPLPFQGFKIWLLCRVRCNPELHLPASFPPNQDWSLDLLLLNFMLSVDRILKLQNFSWKIFYIFELN